MNGLAGVISSSDGTIMNARDIGLTAVNLYATIFNKMYPSRAKVDAYTMINGFMMNSPGIFNQLGELALELRMTRPALEEAMEKLAARTADGEQIATEDFYDAMNTVDPLSEVGSALAAVGKEVGAGALKVAGIGVGIYLAYIFGGIVIVALMKKIASSPAKIVMARNPSKRRKRK